MTDDRPPEASHPSAHLGGTAVAPAGGGPRVEVLVVASPGGGDLQDFVASAVSQDYPRTSVRILADAASGTEVASASALATDAVAVHVMEVDTTAESAAINRVLAKAAHPAYYVVCEAGVALAPDSVRLLVEEAIRSNAGIVGPKLVDFDDPDRILAVGLGVDKLAHPVPLVEPGELDQEQHDAVTDVFAVTRAAMLIRADLFEALRGFDEAMEAEAADVDLCWRAHCAGARVLVAPSAVVRQRADTGEREPGPAAEARRRGQLMTVLSGYGRWHTIRVLPQAVVATLTEVVVGVLTGHFGAARAAAGAWAANLARLPTVLSRRRALRRIRRLPDRELRPLQVSGFAPLSAFFRDHARERAPGASPTDPAQAGLRAFPQPSGARVTWMFWGLVVALFGFGSRHLLTRSIPVLGDLVPVVGGPGEQFQRWWSGWQTGGVGRDAPTPSLAALLGLAEVVGLGQPSLTRTMLLLVLAPLGGAGMWRLLGAVDAAPAQVAGATAYLSLPLWYTSLANGSLSGLVAFAAMPWLVLELGRAGGVFPAGRRRSWVGHGMVAGIVVGLAAAAAPDLVLWFTVAALLLLLGSLLSLEPFRFGGAAGAAALAVVVAVVLHVPWSADVLLSGRADDLVLGTAQPRVDGVPLTDLLRLRTGSFPGGWLSYAWLLAASLALVLGRGERWAWAVRGWTLYVGGVGGAWLLGLDGLPMAAPRPEPLLAIAGCGLAISVGVGVASFQRDLPAYRFGWRQVVPLTAAVAVVLGVLPVLGATFDGRWSMDNEGHQEVLARLASADEVTGARAVWIGHDDVLTPAGLVVGDDTTLAVTDDLLLGSTDGVALVDDGATLIRDAVEYAVGGGTQRLGRLLGPFGVRYVVVVEQLSPAPDDRLVVAADPLITTGLSEQLDLAEVVRLPNFTVYRNEAWTPVASTIGSDDLAGSSPGAALTRPPPGAAPLQADDGVVPDWTGQARAGAVWFAVPVDSDWRVTLDGRPQARTVGLGWATRVPIAEGGTVVVSHERSPRPVLMASGQAAIWLLVLAGILWRPTDPGSAQRRFPRLRRGRSTSAAGGAS